MNPAHAWAFLVSLALFPGASVAWAQASAEPKPEAPPAQPSSPPNDDGAAQDPMAAFAWLAGCWKGTVNQREFREMWLPLQGGMMIGAGQQVQGAKMQDYEFLRLEPRVDGVRFTQFSGERTEVSFRLASTATDGNDTVFTFANASEGFPARLIYRRGQEGWLYETIEGNLNGADRKVIYPLRRISCETGELIRE
jgi:hypothetical protein